MRSYVSGDIEIGIVHRDANWFTSDAREDFMRTLKDSNNTITGSFEKREDLISHLHALSK